MKYLKTYEMRLGSTIPNNVEPEIIKLFDYLKMLVMGLKDTYWKDDELSGRINVECNKDDKEWKTYSIILNCYYYFIYQFDYKEDGMWIKYTCNNEMNYYYTKDVVVSGT